MTSSKLKDKTTDRFFDAIMTLKTQKECYKFFEDICTISELKAIAQRLEVAGRLKDGETYEEIVQQTGMSTATIARIKRCLDYGSGGYRLILNRLDAVEKGEKNVKR